MKRTPMKYKINGRVYRFEMIYWKDGYYHGRCVTKPHVGKNAVLGDNFIRFEGETIILAERIL